MIKIFLNHKVWVFLKLNLEENHVEKEIPLMILIRVQVYLVIFILIFWVFWGWLIMSRTAMTERPAFWLAAEDTDHTFWAVLVWQTAVIQNTLSCHWGWRRRKVCIVRPWWKIRWRRRFFFVESEICGWRINEFLGDVVIFMGFHTAGIFITECG